LHIELIATDGKIQKRILWIDATSNGVYSGYCHENRDDHVSYHFDGNVYQNIVGEKPKKTLTLPPLSDRGWHQLTCVGFTSDLSRLHDTPLYNLKKLDAMVSIDVRTYKRGIGCLLYLIEPNRRDLLSEIIKTLPETMPTEIHSFLRCNPWISMVIYGNLYSEMQIK
jgi:hypothetical protein